METMLVQALNLFLFPLQLLAAAMLYVAEEKRRDHFWQRAVGSIFLFLALTAVTSVFPVWLNVYLHFAIVTVCIHLTFDIPFAQLLFDTTCAYATQHLAYQISLLAVSVTPAELAVRLAVQCATFVAVYAAVYGLVVRKLRSYQRVRHMTRTSAVVFAVLLLVAILLACVTINYPPANFISGFQMDLPPEQSIFLLAETCSLYSVTCCMLILWLQVDIRRELTMQHELDLQKQLWLKNKEQYEFSRENIAIINRKCHDLKYQIGALRQFYSDEQRERYLDQIENSVMVYDSMIRTGNEVLDTVLTEKKLRYDHDGIELTCVADGACLPFLDSIDLYTLLNNALNNAIEAVARLEDAGDRAISIHVYEKLGLAFVQVENSFAGTLELVNGLPRTTKDDDITHGYGLKSIRHIAEKYDGFLRIETRDGMFILRVSFPTQQ